MIKHALIEGFKNLTRSFWLSATAITVLAVSLGSVAMIAIFSTTVGFTLRQLNNQLAITAYFKRDIDQQTVDQALKELSTIPDVKTIRYVDQESATKELIEGSNVNTNLEETLKNKEINLVLTYVEITPNSVTSYDTIIATVNSQQFNNLWQNVQGTEEFRQSLEQFYFFTNVVLIILVLIFAITSILVMINILRIAIYSHKDEIEIMRLVGATNGYIQGPFIAEGAFFNLIAAIVILGIFIPGINFALPVFENFVRIDSSTDTQNLVIQLYITVITTILIGVVSGLVTAYLATQRYLKL